MARLAYFRQSFIENFVVDLVIDHERNVSASERIHDAAPRTEKVRFDVELIWRSVGAIEEDASGSDVVNYAAVYRYLESLSATTLTAPLEHVLDRICEVGLTDPRVEEVNAKAVRLDVASPARVGIAVRRQTLRNRF